MYQEYQTDVTPEYVIKGNAAIVKCLIPSFVADFVSVQSWVTDRKDVYRPTAHYGNAFERFPPLPNIYFFQIKSKNSIIKKILSR